MKKILFSLFMLSATLSFAQQPDFNMTLIGTNDDYSSDQYNDIWGYVDGSGTEYAIIGSRVATIIYSLEDPTNPTEVAYIPGATSTWRDAKSFGDFVYVTTDVGNDGLLVIDMSGAPDNITHEFWTPTLSVGNETATLQTCHNLYIDENGYCYLSGCNLNDGGVLIIDVFSDPGNPIYVGAADRRYSHDNFVRGDTLWSSDILDGYFSVIDVSDKENPVTLATAGTSFDFTHNAWLSDDGNYLFTTDERENANLDAYDVSDLNDIQRLDTYHPAATSGTNVIPHNTHYYNGYLVTSWYTDGVKIVDGSRPSNLIEVGSYDTYMGNQGGFNGCWGVYPFLPSGLVIAADINSGLYVFEVDYTRACYLEGTVTDAQTGATIFGVSYDILDVEFEKPGSSDLNGYYKTGLAEAGTYQVQFSKAGYEPVTAEAILENGELTILNVQMNLLPNANVTGRVIDEATQLGIPGAKVVLINEEFNFEATTDNDGNFSLNTVFLGAYDAFAGAWGYLHNSINGLTINSAQEVVIELTGPGYQDDFIMDFEWTTDADPQTTSGFWTRGVPNPTIFGNVFSNPNEDIAGDLGNQCYVTGNFGGDMAAGTDDIDGGNVQLLSPAMDLSGYVNPTLSYNLWFFNQGGAPPQNDMVTVSISNGSETIELESVTESNGGWRPTSEFDLTGLMDFSSPVRVLVESGDQQNTGHLVEAGFDAFLVTDANASNTNILPAEAYQLQLAPNPFSDQTTISYLIDNNFRNARIHLTNVVGQRVQTIELMNASGQIQLGQQLEAGVYFLQMEVDNQISNAGKMIKTNN